MANFHKEHLVAGSIVATTLLASGGLATWYHVHLTRKNPRWLVTSRPSPRSEGHPLSVAPPLPYNDWGIPAGVYRLH